MSKVVTVRMENDLYKAIKDAARAENRTISNYIEYAASRFLHEAQFVSDEEMKDITANPDFAKNVKTSANDIKKGKFRIAR